MFFLVSLHEKGTPEIASKTELSSLDWSPHTMIWGKKNEFASPLVAEAVDFIEEPLSL